MGDCESVFSGRASVHEQDESEKVWYRSIILSQRAFARLLALSTSRELLM